MTCKYHVKMQEYLDKMEEIRRELRHLSSIAIQTDSPVDSKFYKLYKDLDRIKKNAKAYNKRHHLDYFIA